jgi:hypothetical protein
LHGPSLGAEPTRLKSTMAGLDASLAIEIGAIDPADPVTGPETETPADEIADVETLWPDFDRGTGSDMSGVASVRPRAAASGPEAELALWTPTLLGSVGFRSSELAPDSKRAAETPGELSWLRTALAPRPGFAIRPGARNRPGAGTYNPLPEFELEPFEEFDGSADATIGRRHIPTEIDRTRLRVNMVSTSPIVCTHSIVARRLAPYETSGLSEPGRAA